MRGREVTFYGRTGRLSPRIGSVQLLSHGLSGVQNLHYDRHTYMDEKRAALFVWEHYLETIAGGAITFGASGYAEGQGKRDEGPNASAAGSTKRRRASSG
ncbi:MAG: hypothetical protein WAK53_16235 [Chromatiaceae bacterium]